MNKFTQADVDRYIEFINLVDKTTDGYSFTNMNDVVKFAKELNWAGAILRKKMEDNILEIEEVKKTKEPE